AQVIAGLDDLASRPVRVTDVAGWVDHEHTGFDAVQQVRKSLSFRRFVLDHIADQNRPAQMWYKRAEKFVGSRIRQTVFFVAKDDTCGATGGRPLENAKDVVDQSLGLGPLLIEPGLEELCGW